MNHKKSLRVGAALVVFAALGALTGLLWPTSLAMPLFMTCIVCIAVLAFAAHRMPTPEHWGKGRKVAASIAVALLGGPSGEIREGPVPQAFLLSFAFTLGLVAMLAAQR